MNLDFFLSWQFGMTLVAALAIGVWQFFSIKRSRDKRNEHGHMPHPVDGPDSHLPPHR
jgi:hypothetical protein